MKWSSVASTVLVLSSLGATASADLAPPKLVGKGPPKIVFSAPNLDATALDPVVVRVGSRSVRRSELEALLGQLHEFERASYGKTPEEVKAGFIQRRLIPELLAAEEAHEKGLDAEPRMAARIRDELVERLKDSIQSDAFAKLTKPEILDYCRSEGGAKPSDAGTTTSCKGDLMGYRVALARTRTAKQLSELVSELRKKNVRAVNASLLARIDLDAKGRVSAAPAATP